MAHGHIAVGFLPVGNTHTHGSILGYAVMMSEMSRVSFLGRGEGGGGS